MDIPECIQVISGRTNALVDERRDVATNDLRRDDY